MSPNIMFTITKYAYSEVIHYLKSVLAIIWCQDSGLVLVVVLATSTNHAFETFYFYLQNYIASCKLILNIPRIAKFWLILFLLGGSTRYEASPSPYFKSSNKCYIRVCMSHCGSICANSVGGNRLSESLEQIKGTTVILLEV